MAPLPVSKYCFHEFSASRSHRTAAAQTLRKTVLIPPANYKLTSDTQIAHSRNGSCVDLAGRRSRLSCGRRPSSPSNRRAKSGVTGKSRAFCCRTHRAQSRAKAANGPAPWEASSYVGEIG
jgi:hypothetical protein